MLHKIRPKTLISLRSPSPSPIVLPCCFIQDVLPNPLSPFIFHVGWNTWIVDRYVVSFFYNCTCCCPNFFCISLCLFCWNKCSCTYNNEFRLKKKLILTLQCKPSSYMFKSHTQNSQPQMHNYYCYIINSSLIGMSSCARVCVHCS